MVVRRQRVKEDTKYGTELWTGLNSREESMAPTHRPKRGYETSRPTFAGGFLDWFERASAFEQRTVLGGCI